MQARPDSAHIPVLDSFRGLFALLVVIFHFPAVFWGASSPIVRHGYLAVDFFFILSGFVLARRYWDAIATGADVTAFARDRVWRLVPLHLIGVAGAAVLTLAHHLIKPETALPVSLADILSTLTLTQSLGLGSSHELNEPNWSLSAEMIAYGLFVIVLLLSRAQEGLRLALFAALSVIGLAGIVMIGSESVAYLDITRLGVVRGLFGFFAGVLLWRASRALTPAPQATRATLCEVAALTLFVLGYALVDVATPATLLLLPIMMVTISVFASARGGVSQRLSHPAFLWLGQRSFAIYILHYPVVWAMKVVLKPLMGRLDSIAPALTPAFATLWLALTLALVLIVADLAHRLVERPLRRHARSGSAQPARDPAQERLARISGQALSTRP